jgi:hypothetical protein
MDFLKYFFGSNKDRDQEIYNIVDVPFSNLESYPSGIDDMINLKIDGFIIRKVLKEKEVATLVKAYDMVPPEDKYNNGAGMFIYPQPFTKIHQMSKNSQIEMNKFFSQAEEFWASFPEKFGFDFVKHIHETLSKISGMRKIATPNGKDGVGFYNPAGFKHLVPGLGEFNAHCGNFFHKEFPLFYKHMNEISIIEDQMSYFIMLSPSQKGGQLTLYDVLWKDSEIRMGGGKILKTHSGKLLELENIKKVKKQYLRPGPGDMIVFSGGRIWHKVERAEKTRRLSLGGFLTKSKDGSSYYTWS